MRKLYWCKHCKGRQPIKRNKGFLRKKGKRDLKSKYLCKNCENPIEVRK